MSTPTAAIRSAHRAGRVLPRILVVMASVVILLVLGGLAKLSLSRADEPSDKPAAVNLAGSAEWFVVEKRSFDLTVLAAGELEAKNQVEIKSQVEGLTTISEIIDEGTPVKGPVRNDKDEIVEPGTLLARLADDKLKDRLDQEMLIWETAKAVKVTAEQALAIEISAAENSKRAAEVTLKLAQLDLKKWELADDKQKWNDLQLALEKAQRTLQRAEEDLKEGEELYKEQFISRGEYEDDQLHVIEAKAGVQTAELALKAYGEYGQPKDREKAQSDVDQAKAALDNTLRKNESDLAKAKADVENATRSFKIHDDTLNKVKVQLESCTVRAPADGTLVYSTSVGSSRRWRDPMQQGRDVRFNETLFVIPNTHQMVAAVRVHEAMLEQVKEGQRVSVTIDARQGGPLQGVVDTIAVTAEDGGWMNPDLREYKVRVDLPPGVDSALKPAMRCTAQVYVGRVENALAVPIQAVTVEGRRHYVFVPAGTGRVRRQAVKLGRASETFVEILEGLAVNDLALLRRPKPGEAVKSSEPDPKDADADAAQDAPKGPVPEFRPKDRRGLGLTDPRRRPEDGTAPRNGDQGDRPKPASGATTQPAATPRPDRPR